MSTTITFLGAAGTVTGSKFLIETGRSQVLLDAGLFQGDKHLRERNWRRFPIDPASLDAVVVSHAHLDHVGILPVLVRDGFAGPVFSSLSTAKLARVVLADSGRIQEEDAKRANTKGYTRHSPALPLYTEHDAELAASRFVTIDWETPTEIAAGISVSLTRAGHILGSASMLFQFSDGTPPLMASGDLGRPSHPILAPPQNPSGADTILVESTYGDTEHLEEDGSELLGEFVTKVAEREGVIIIPAFAIDRTEVILHSLTRLARSGRIPAMPVYLDSPMARSALGFYTKAIVDHHEDIRPDVAGKPEVLDPGDLRIVETPEESKAINRVAPPFVVISASGMATGGRVLHHLKRNLPDARSGVVLVGYQATGTRGQILRDGADTVRIHGEEIAIRASVTSIPAFSVHADRSELLDWIVSQPPRRVIAVHGDSEAATGLKDAIETRLRIPVDIPGDGDTLQL